MTTIAKTPGKTARRLRRGALVAGVAGAALVALPSTAFAAVASYSGPVAAGQAICRHAYASYQARVEGFSNKDVSYTFYRNGALLDWRVGVGAAAEYRTSFGNFPGAGYYKVCVTNNVGGGTSGVTATIAVTTDGNLY